jgi:hypothetical protein
MVGRNPSARHLFRNRKNEPPFSLTKILALLRFAAILSAHF